MDEVNRQTLLNKKVRKDQLETLASCQFDKRLNDVLYNGLIDKCNDTDEEIAQFFKFIAANDREEVQRCINANPLIAYEVNDRMETALHVAVTNKHYDLVESILESDFGKYLVKAVDLRKMTPLDLARQSK